MMPVNEQNGVPTLVIRFIVCAATHETTYKSGLNVLEAAAVKRDNLQFKFFYENFMKNGESFYVGRTNEKFMQITIAAGFDLPDGGILVIVVLCEALCCIVVNYSCFIVGTLHKNWKKAEFIAKKPRHTI